MIEALKIIIMACQLGITNPTLQTSLRSKLNNEVLIVNQQMILKTQLEYQRSCQQRLVECWLENKRNKVKWPLSTCFEAIR